MRIWDKNRSSCLRSQFSYVNNRDAHSELVLQTFKNPVRLMTGDRDVDVLKSNASLARRVHLLSCDFYARNDLDKCNVQKDLTWVTEKAWALCEGMAASDTARCKAYVSYVVALLKGESVSSPNLSSSSSSSNAILPAPTNTSSLFGTDPNRDLRDKALENLARFVGIGDSSIPSLAAGITTNGVRMPNLIIPFQNRFVVSKHYPHHPNMIDPQVVQGLGAQSETGSTRGGHGGFRGGFRGGRGGRGGHQSNNNNGGGGNVNEGGNNGATA